MKPFSIFKNGTLSETFTTLLKDKSFSSAHDTFKVYLTKYKLKCSKEEQQKLLALLEEQLISEIERYAILYYLVCQQSQKWGDIGEQQTSISLCRLFLNSDESSMLTQEDSSQFFMVLDEKIKKYHLENRRDFHHQLNIFHFQLLGQSIPKEHFFNIQKYLHFFGSQLYLYGGKTEQYFAFVLGEGHEESIGGYKVFSIQKEVMRTPNIITTMAAIIGDRRIFMRNSAIRTIFYQKWQYYAEKKESTRALSTWSEAANTIKNTVLDYYAPKQKQSVDDIKEPFLADMYETILKHELGHGIVQHHILPLQAAAMGEATKVFGETIYSSILEFMADFSPAFRDEKGPIQNMIDISKTDYKRAKRMYWMYISDTWFYNTKDTFMYDYSDMMSLILFKYIEADKHIRFDKLEADIQFNKASALKSPATLFERLYILFVEDMKHILNLAREATFSVKDQELNFKQIQQFIHDLFKKNDGYANPETYTYQVSFWTNMFSYINTFSDKKSQLIHFLENQRIITIKKTLLMTCGTKKADHIKYNHRYYILKRAYQLGLTSQEPTAETSSIPNPN